jgi:hypothetical protein
MAEEVVVSEGGVGARPKISWSAVFAGTVVALGLWALLYAFGLAVGLTALDPQDPATARGAGIGTGIWSVIAPLIALFVGGYMAGVLANVREGRVGAMHGAVLWGLTTLVGIVLLGAVFNALVSGVARLGARAVEAAPGAAQQLSEFLGVGGEELIAPINERLEAQGRPTITPQQFQAALQDAAQRALREGELTRQTLEDAFVARTPLDRQDARAVAVQVEQRWQEARERGLAGPELQRRALAAGETAGRVMWAAFGALLLGLLAAVGGGVLGALRTGGFFIQRRRAARVVSEPAAPAAPVTPSEARP